MCKGFHVPEKNNICLTFKMKKAITTNHKWKVKQVGREEV